MTIEQVLIDCGFDWMEEERGKDYFAVPVPSATNTHKPGTIATLRKKELVQILYELPPGKPCRIFLVSPAPLEVEMAQFLLAQNPDLDLQFFGGTLHVSAHWRTYRTA